MTNNEVARIKGTLFAADLFGKDYIKSHIREACEAYYEEGDFAKYFLGFAADSSTNKWTEYMFVQMLLKDGTITPLDYRLPSGERMNNPIEKVRCA